MARPKNRTPQYIKHKASGRGQVCWTDASGRPRSKTFPGAYESTESRAAYHQFLAELDIAPHGAVGGVASKTMLADLLLGFLVWAVKEYATREGKEPSSELRHFKTVIKVVRELYGEIPAAEFGPICLKAVRGQFVAAGWCRQTVNRQTQRVVRIFRWGVAEQLVEPATYQALEAVLELRRGRTEARETAPRESVSEDTVEATLPYLNRHVRGLVRLQLLTVCRPGEAMRVSFAQIDTSTEIWLYRPSQHKNSHRGQDRVIPIGPQAQKLLKGFRTEDPADYLFSPSKAAEEVRAARAANRKTPVYPSSVRRKEQTKPKANPKRRPTSCYRRESYLNSIIRACDRAFPAPGELAKREGETAKEWKDRLTPQQQEELREWQKAHRWCPYRLRHTAATKVRKVAGLEAAQEILGHRLRSTTEGYAKPGSMLATEVASRIG